MKIALVLILFVAIALADPPVNMPVSVAAGGAVNAVNTSGHRVHGTIAQPLASRTLHVSGIAHLGFWPSRHASAPLAVERVVVELPNKLEFLAAYPNPFNPATQLKFSLPNTAQVKLTLFDVTGRNVATLADDVFQAGTYSATWNAQAFASGAYFARLETAGFTHTQKLVLLK